VSDPCAIGILIILFGLPIPLAAIGYRIIFGEWP